MEEKRHKKSSFSYEEVIKAVDECISRDEPVTADERIKRVEEMAEQMEEECKKGMSCRKKVSRFFRRSLINLDRSVRRYFGK